MIKLWLLISVTAAWSFIFAVAHLTLRISIRRKSLLGLRRKVVSVFHALFSLWYSIPSSMQGDELGSPFTDFQEICLTISLGYYIFDTVVLYLSEIQETSMMIHHFTAVFLLLYCVHMENGVSYLIYPIFIAQFSVPFLQLKEILKILNQQDTKVYLAAELAYFFCFLGSKFGLGLPFIYDYFCKEDAILALKIILLVFASMFLYWTKAIILVFSHRCVQYSERRSKGIGLEWINRS